MDGKPAAAPLQLNPGAKVVGIFKDMGADNAYGYGILYDGLCFGPLGFLLVLAARKPSWRKFWILPALLLPPVLLEIVLCTAGPQPFRIGKVLLGEGLIAGAFLLLNSDRRGFVGGSSAAEKPN